MKINKLLLSIALLVILIVSIGWINVSAISNISERQENILYVKSGSDGDCLSWETACELQTAFDNAESGDEIWVAEGIYKPRESDGRYATFQLVNGISIYGGFPISGGDWEERNWEDNTTILSGDVGEEGNIEDNCFHVITAYDIDNDTIIDGISIVFGNADYTFPYNSGGGIFNDGSSPTINNTTICQNYASGHGGGIYNINNSNPTLDNVVISNNTAGMGGGMYNEYSNPQITNVEITNNEGIAQAGGIYNEYSDPIISLVTFSENTSGYAGGIKNNRSNPQITNATFSRNTARYSGGGILNNYSDSMITNSTFIENTAGDGGGGISINRSSPTIKNCTFTGNIAREGGGISACEYSSPILTNVTIFENSASRFGGGIYIRFNSNPILTNVTIFENSASEDGGGVHIEESHPTIINSIVWSDITSEQIYISSSSSANVTYSDIQTEYIFPGDGNIKQDPLLGYLADNGGYTQTHALLAGSPAIDAGDPNNCTETDQRDYLRPIDGDDDGSAICDMGAFEYNPSTPIYELSVNLVGEGQVQILPNQYQFYYENEVTLTANAELGWTFTGWSGDVTSTDNPLVVTIEGDTNITANFIFQLFMPLMIN